MPDMASLSQCVDAFPSTRLIVVGDVMLDDYLWGQVSRISPEAPVPIVDVTEQSYRLGGAANVSHNIAALDGSVALCGIVGDDESGRRLVSLLKSHRIATDALIIDHDRPTTRKTRVLAHHQQVVRVDRESKAAIGGYVQQQLLTRIEQLLPTAQYLVLSDYAKGVITESFVKDLLKIAQQYGVKIVADPKVSNFDYMVGATVATPNHLEAQQIAGHQYADSGNLDAIGRHLLARLKAEALLITRGEEGMSLFERDGQVTAIPTFARQVYDVTGAGDTVAAVLAMALAAGARMLEAAQLANIAAGIVVGIVGTATLDRAELQHAIQRMPPDTA